MSLNHNDGVVTVAKGYAPIATGFLGGTLKYLDIVNSLASLCMVLIGILGAYWLYRKNKAEALRVDAENETFRLANEKSRIEIEAKELEQQIEKSTALLIEKIAGKIK